ncbi:hypothetical protein N015_21720 [Pseudomonas asturiensis]|uniref:Uncharacterized protein n=1 Tax=Pseudomonas asturiensis TaxID=1190415 RepID=A0ABX6HGZ8_9PSED|nr:hypothetical protein [Pseudomonas asturiensis]QHF04880.1 hypothetical protein N015_21720 [Pseudomonas asturiensis]
MNTAKKTGFNQYLLLALIGLGVWVPVVWTALAFYASSAESPMKVGSAIVLLGQLEIFAIIFLVIYAFCFKPWRLSTTARLGFFFNVLGAAAAAVGIIVALANM